VVRGGMTGWLKAGLPVTRGRSQTPFTGQKRG
jgi:hypothetical protein